MVNFGKRLCSLALVIAFVILLIPSFDLQPKAAYVKEGFYHFTEDDVAVINQALINEIASKPGYEKFAQSPTFVIEQGVYSVTVMGPFTYEGKTISVNIVFGTEEGGEYEGVTIDRTNESGNGVGTSATGRTTLQTLYEAGQTLGWSNGNNRYYVPTAPFLITGGAKVNALFLGDCTFKAGTNRAYVTQQTDYWGNTTYSWGAGGNRGGYAGIQVDGNSSLTILNVVTNPGGKGLSAYGGHQLPGKNEDPLDVNPKYEENNAYRVPSGSNSTRNAGGAGIGGGVSYNQDTAQLRTYTNGTPGEIIINNGKIYAVGGHLAAGIGGGLNGASTTSKIEINGGDITAIGGRFATGIGDGDSINGATTTNYALSNQILINGGNITAYGGTASAAIGTTDNISIQDGGNQTSGLKIVISGGTIQAQSGEADASKGNNSQTIYTAAIGVGQGTNMQDNSITIHSDATVFARSFSQYAISNKGVATDAAAQSIPMVNIDPNGFMYLARFKQDTNNERELTLYPVFTDTNGNPVSVRTAAYNILGGEPIEEYYAQTEVTDGNGQPKRALYKLTKVMVDEKPVFIPDLDANNDYQYLYTNGASWGFSYYYDVTAEQTFIVPPKYKAVALSLGKGDYVFHVPRNGDNGLADDVFCHFNKHLSGTTSVEVEEQNPSPTHFTYRYDQHIQETTETPNVNVDKTAIGLVSMQITAQPGNTEMLVGDDAFQSTVLGYEVYIPNDSTSFVLDFSYLLNDPSIVGHSVQKISITQKGARANGTNKDTFELSGNQLDGSHQYTFQFTQTGNQFNSVGEIWLNKIDVIEGESVFVTYKIVVVCKPKYYIHTEALSKKYDGVPVSPQITKVTETRGEEILETVEPHYAYGTTLAEYGSHVSTHEPAGYDPSKLDGGAAAEFVQTYNAGGKPVTIGYAVVPNATETSVSLITRFSYTDANGVNVNKRSTVNINMDGQELVFTLDESSDNVLMASQTGGYRIETEMIVGNDGTGPVEEGIGKTQKTNTVTWNIYIVYYDRENISATPNRDPILSFTAQEVISYGEAQILPTISGDGKKVYESEAAARAQARTDAETAFENNSWETRYSDSYFFATGIRKTETFTLNVGHRVNTSLENFNYRIVDDYMYRYHKFHYYAELRDEGDVIPFSNDQIQEVLTHGCTYYVDDGVGTGDPLKAGDGILQAGELASATNTAPKDAGDYILVLDYIGDEYEAHTSVAFEIRKRPIRIIGVQNHVTYLTQAQIAELQSSNQPVHLKTYPEVPGIGAYDFGEVYYDDVVSGDVIQLSDQIFAYYNEITISYNLDKITLRYNEVKDDKGNIIAGRQIDWLDDKANEKDAQGNYLNDNRNYEMTGVSNFDSSSSTIEHDISFSFVHVPGMLSYTAKGTIFKRADDSATAVWRKFWPTWSEVFLKWNTAGDKDDFGNFKEPDIMEDNIDYYSPSNASHQDYVFIRTVNANRGKTYSIDIEYGTMDFEYAEAIWDVNTHQYVKGDKGHWNGNDGVTNRIIIRNYSDVPIQYTASFEMSQIFGMTLEAGFSDEYNVITNENQRSMPIASANKDPYDDIPDNIEGENFTTFYFVVDGRPLNRERTQIGSIWLTIESYHPDP